MDKTTKLMKKYLPAVILCLVCLPAMAQISYKWTPVAVDSTYSVIKDSTATYIIRKFDPMLAPIYETIGTSDDEYAAKRPESGLSNFVADVIRQRAEKECGRKVHLAMTNFGGIRTSLPKGNVTLYDIMSIFPFKNYIEVFDIKGEDLVRFFNRNARNPEALSGVKLVVTDGRVESLEVGGKPVCSDSTYTFASIDFLIDGGDGVTFRNMVGRKSTGVLIRTAIEDHIRQLTSEGGTLHLESDGRVIINRKNK